MNCLGFGTKESPVTFLFILERELHGIVRERELTCLFTSQTSRAGVDLTSTDVFFSFSFERGHQRTWANEIHFMLIFFYVYNIYGNIMNVKINGFYVCTYQEKKIKTSSVYWTLTIISLIILYWRIIKKYKIKHWPWCSTWLL